MPEPLLAARLPFRPTTDVGRFLIGILIGGACGGAEVAGLALNGFLTHGRHSDVLAYVPGVFILGTLAWLIGLSLVGGPVVFLIYRTGAGSRAAAAVAGGVLAFSAMLLFQKAWAPHMRWSSFLDSAAPIGVGGILVGWVFAWVAYGSKRGANG
jgi:hypothetical protein